MFYLFFLLTLLCQCGDFQGTNIKQMTETYETNLNSSLLLEKEDRRLRGSWQVDLQLRRVQVTARYRLQATRHRDQCFKDEGNQKEKGYEPEILVFLDKEDPWLRCSRQVDLQLKRVQVTARYRLQAARNQDQCFKDERNQKWSQCLYLHRRMIRKCTKDYHSNESECLTTATLEDEERMSGVKQVEKEIRKWRRGYRYLLNKCETENFGDKDAMQECLVEYMEKDHYNQVIERLIILKLEAMGSLYLEMTNSVTILEECLKTQLSAFLENLRTTMEVLKKCYSIKASNVEHD